MKRHQPLGELIPEKKVQKKRKENQQLQQSQIQTFQTNQSKKKQQSQNQDKQIETKIYKKQKIVRMWNFDWDEQGKFYQFQDEFDIYPFIRGLIKNNTDILVEKFQSKADKKLIPQDQRIRFQQNVFSNELRKLKKQAYLSKNIIDKIYRGLKKKQQKEVNDISDIKTLREQILEIIGTELQGQTCELSSIFKKGVCLEYFQNRERFISALNSSQKLTFFPTKITTTKIFKTILNKQYYYISIGYYGIGKSINVLLYRRLSGIIYRYFNQLLHQINAYTFKLQKNPSFSDQLQHNPNLSDQPNISLQNYFQLQAKQFKLNQYPKLVYITLNEQTTPQLIFLSVIDQIKHQIDASAFQREFQNRSGIIKELKSFYQQKYSKESRIILVVDQINFLSSKLALLLNQVQIVQKQKSEIKHEMKKLKNKHEMKQQKSQQEMKELEQKQRINSNRSFELWMQQNQLFKIRDIIKKLSYHFNATRYLSSSFIPNQILEKLHLGERRSEMLQIQKIFYQRNARKAFAQLEIIQFFKFQLQRQLGKIYVKIKNYEEVLQQYFTNNKQLINESLLILSNDPDIKFFKSPLSIKQVIAREAQKLKVFSIQNLLKQNQQFYDQRVKLNQQKVNINQDKLTSQNNEKQKQDKNKIREDKITLLQQIIRIFILVQSQSILLLRKKFDKFLNKGQKGRLKLMFKIFYEIKQIIREQNQNIVEREMFKIERQKQIQNKKSSSVKKSNEILNEQFEYYCRQQIDQQIEQIKIQLSEAEWIDMHKQIDERIFNIQRIGSEVIVKLLVPIRNIYSILSSIMENKFQELNQAEFLELLSSSAINSYMQGLIIKVFSIPATQWNSKLNTFKLGDTVNIFQPIPAFKNDSVSQQRPYHFMSKNQDLQLTVKNPQFSHLFLPYFKTQYKDSRKIQVDLKKINWRSQNSKAIDMIITQTCQEQKEIKIYCFDVLGKPKDIITKLKTFIEVYKRSFKNRNNPRVKIENNEYRLRVYYLVLIPSFRYVSQNTKDIKLSCRQLEFKYRQNLRWSVKSKKGKDQLLQEVGVELFETDSITNEEHQIQKYLSAFPIIKKRR